MYKKIATLQNIGSICKYEEYKKNNFLDSKVRLLERFKKNKIKLKFNKNDKILIFGTINYFIAVKSLGSKKIEATDICKRPSFLPTNIKYKKINNHKLPFRNNYFRFVFSNGILSHLPKYKNYFKEIYRVLNKKGFAWINVYGSSKLEKIRYKVAKKLNKSDLLNFKKVLVSHKWDNSKINFILELLNKSNNYTFNKLELEKIFKNSGFRKYKFCPRGYKSDLSEQIYNNKEMKKIFNYGDLRYLIYK